MSVRSCSGEELGSGSGGGELGSGFGGEELGSGVVVEGATHVVGDQTGASNVICAGVGGCPFDFFPVVAVG